MRDRILEGLDRLTPAERKVAELVAADPRAVIGSTLAQVAKAASVSDPTVVRFCRSLGLEGFNELRIALALAEGQAAPRKGRRIHAGMPVPEAATAVLDSAIAALAALRAGLAVGPVEGAARALVGARQVEVWGAGGSAGLAEAIADRLFRVCRSVTARRDPAMQAMATAGLGADSAVLCVSCCGRTRDLVEAARLAAASRATVIALAPPGSPLATVSNLAIGPAEEAAEGLHAPMTTAVALLALGDVLAVAAGLLSPPSAEERLARMEAALRSRRVPDPR
jgi:RpiR family carbohydrate utilization transcriptional regulator